MDKDIASGWYATEDGHTTSVAHWLDEDDFRGNGGVMNHETVESISKRRKPFTVDYAGFGWLLIKNGVFEHPEIKYPWFAPKICVEKMYHSVWMQRKQDLKFGATLACALDTKKQGLFDMTNDNETYNILCKGRRIYTGLTEEEYFNVMEDLSIEFYQTGSPRPEDIETEILTESKLWQKADH
jgi:hypothetical protein